MPGTRPIRLTSLLGRPCAGGRIDDLLVRAGGPAWRVDAIRVGRETRSLGWRGGEPEPGRAVDAGGLRSLRRDVLDRQIVDVAGRRVVRVGEVMLAPADGGLAVVAIEVGLRPVLRRLGLARLVRGQGRDLLRPDAVDVTDSCLVAHVAADRLADVETRHLARLIRRLPHAVQGDVLRRLPRERHDEVRSHIRRHPHRPRLRRFRTPRRA